MTGWADGYGAWIPRRESDKLYGRGGADDGYAMFGALSALLALREQSIPQARCVVLIEACEESGSYDLPYYVDLLAAKLGDPSLVICLDSGCGNYDQLWLTTSLRGMASGTLTVQVLNRTWRRQLAVTGIDGLPPPENAGNVLLPSTVAKLSLRLPPTLNAAAAASALSGVLEKNPPYGARVLFTQEASAAGWNA